MGWSLGGSKNKSKSSSSFKENVWKPQGAALENMYGDVSKLFGQTNEGMQALTPQAVENQQQVFEQSQPFWQNQMQGGAYRDMNLGQNVMRSLNDSMNQPTAMQDINSMIMGGSGNNYADAMRNQYMTDANHAMDNMNANLDARAAGTGMGGSSRHGVAQGMGMRDINENLQRNMANVGYNTFDKDLNRKLQIAQQADQNTFGRQKMMADMLGGSQTAMTQGLQQGQGQQELNMGQYAPYNQPWAPAESRANITGRPTVLGSGTSSGSSSGWGFNASDKAL